MRWRRLAVTHVRETQAGAAVSPSINFASPLTRPSRFSVRASVQLQMCLLWQMWRAEALRFRQKKNSLYSFWRIPYKKISISWLAWQSALLAIVCKNPPIINEERWFLETVTVPLCQNHSWIKLKPIAKIKIARQLVWQCLCRSISYMQLLSDISSFFVIVLTFCVTYTVLFWLYKILCSQSSWLEVRGWNIWDEMGRQEHKRDGWYQTDKLQLHYQEEKREHMKGQLAGWGGLQLVLSLMKELMGCGRDKRWMVIQMKQQYRGWSRERGWGGGGCADAPPRVLSVHFVKQRCGVSSDGHGCALDHGAGWRSGRHPLGFLPPLCFFLLQPLLRHLAPVHCRGAAAAWPAGREDREGGV